MTQRISSFSCLENLGLTSLTPSDRLLLCKFLSLKGFFWGVGTDATFFLPFLWAFFQRHFQSLWQCHCARKLLWSYLGSSHCKSFVRLFETWCLSFFHSGTLMTLDCPHIVLVFWPQTFLFKLGIWRGSFCSYSDLTIVTVHCKRDFPCQTTRLFASYGLLSCPESSCQSCVSACLLPAYFSVLEWDCLAEWSESKGFGPQCQHRFSKMYSWTFCRHLVFLYTET